MCVIICKPAGKELAETDVRGAHRANPDGFGLMYYDEEKKDIIARKEVFKEPDKIIKAVKALKDVDACFHFRIRTHGPIAYQTCHPFRVTNKEKHGMTIYLMHNGIIHGMKEKQDESDTQAFVNSYLHELLKRDPSMIESEAFRDLIENKIGANNKLCFMYGEGKIIRFNERSWMKHEDMDVSNRNFVSYGGYNNYDYTSGRRKKSWEKDEDSTKSSAGTSSPTVIPVSAPKMGDKGKVASLCGTPVAVGSSVFITHRQEPDWYAEGKITDINSSFSVAVTFTDRFNKPVSFAFFTSTGVSTYASADVGYQCIPMNRKSPDMDKTIRTLTASTTDPLPKSDDVCLLEDKSDKKKEEQTQSVTKEAHTLNVSHGTLTVDANSRWGGELLNNENGKVYDITYETGTSFVDIFLMSPQDRFNFYMNNVQESFNMWQDLVEKVISDQVDEGTLAYENGILMELVPPDTEDDDEEESMSKEEMEAMHDAQDVMMIAAGMKA